MLTIHMCLGGGVSPMLAVFFLSIKRLSLSLLRRYDPSLIFINCLGLADAVYNFENF